MGVGITQGELSEVSSCFGYGLKLLIRPCLVIATSQKIANYGLKLLIRPCLVIATSQEIANSLGIAISPWMATFQGISTFKLLLFLNLPSSKLISMEGQVKTFFSKILVMGAFLLIHTMSLFNLRIQEFVQ